MRGEQRKWAVTEICRIGSPPLARGTGNAVNPYQFFPRITPACAGNSVSGCPSALQIRDHPRLRGEQFAWYLAVWVMAGSPPLARGTDPAGG